MTNEQRIKEFGGGDQAAAIARHQQLREALPGLKKAQQQQKFNEIIPKLWENITAKGQDIGFGVGQWIGQKKIQANWLMETVKNIFTGDQMKKRPGERSLAEAMIKGSEQAYSAIVQSSRGNNVFESVIKGQTQALLQPLNLIAKKDALPVELVGAIV